MDPLQIRQIYLTIVPHQPLPKTPNLPQSPFTNSTPPQNHPIDIPSPHIPLWSLKIIQHVSPIPAPELAKHHRTTGNRSAYWNRGCCYAKERNGRACHLEPNFGEHREAMGGDATAGTGRSMDGPSWSHEDQLGGVDSPREESWYVFTPGPTSTYSQSLI